MRSLGKILLVGLLTLTSIPFASAQQAPDMFLVEISPSSFDANTAVDVTVKAVKANGDIVKDYQGDVYLDIKGSLDTADYVLPSEGLYSFLPQDQGIKTFSKGLIINKEGTFTISASDIADDTIKGEKTVIVGNANTTHNADSTSKDISIISPSSGSTIKSDVVEIMGSGSLQNSPFEILLNGQASYNGTTDGNGGLVAYVNGLQDGKNTVQVRISDINDTVLAESDPVSITYDPLTDSTFNSIQTLPGNVVSAGSKVKFIVKTSAAVNSTTIKLSNGTSAPMDMDTEGSFSKELTIDKEGKWDISIDIVTPSGKKTYSNVSLLVVEPGTTIGKVRSFSDSVYKNKLTLTWDITGTTPPKYLVSYGTSSDNLNQTQTVTQKEVIFENLTQGSTYYFQISPLDSTDKTSGVPSDIINATIGDSSAMSCTVQGILVNDIIEGNTHLLTRSGVQNVEKYLIYRSEEKTDIDHMQKVGETTDTRFEYPYNPNAKQEKYSYYAVQAICKDGKAIVIDDIKKVKTGPVENILLFVFMSLFFYASYRLYGYNKA